jgi:hypothetical protein
MVHSSNTRHLSTLYGDNDHVDSLQEIVGEMEEMRRSHLQFLENIHGTTEPSQSSLAPSSSLKINRRSSINGQDNGNDRLNNHHNTISTRGKKTRRNVNREGLFQLNTANIFNDFPVSSSTASNSNHSRASSISSSPHSIFDIGMTTKLVKIFKFMNMTLRVFLTTTMMMIRMDTIIAIDSIPLGIPTLMIYMNNIKGRWRYQTMRNEFLERVDG